MNKFEYTSPRTKELAVKLLNDDTAVLAGGTCLISALKDGLLSPKRLVNIKEIRELKGIDPTASGELRIGALATVEEVIDCDRIQNMYPSIRQAALGIRSAQIQSVGTVGGDLCQYPRCWYFRNGYGLLAEKDGKSMVLEGDNRYHAILGNEGPAYFVSASSFAPPLIALGAKVQIYGTAGSREIPLEDFFKTPKSNEDRIYDLKQGEIVTQILVPPAEGIACSTYEVREREALDWPLVSASAALEMDGDVVKSARIAMGHVAPVPWLSSEASAALAGKKVTAETAGQAGEAGVAKAKPLSHNQYKIRLAHVAVKRAIMSAAGMEV
jgi:xanthine dehydrogenase YagS FAD-binding subunit